MEDLEFFKSALNLARIQFKENEPLAPKTTFKVGNTATLFLIPNSREQFRASLSASKSQESPFFVLGGGSNVVFADTPYDGIIISTQNLNKINIKENNEELSVNNTSLPIQENEVLVTCECGTPMATFVNFCTKNNLSGAEQFAGLPGTIGGAVYMNARCFEKSISDIIYSTEHLELLPHGQSKFVKQDFESSQWDYKKSPFQSGQKFITSATFKLTKLSSEQHEQLEANCKKYINERVEKGHFKFPSAGSVFKNNRNFGKPSGALIDEVGLKGTTIGGAQIAPFHGNFIININNATSTDIKKLVKLCQEKVKDKFGFDLVTEIIFI